MAGPSKKVIWIGMGVTGLALVAFAMRPRAIPVEVTAAARGALVVTVDEEGQTRVRDRYVVVAPAAGRVARITLEEGTPVEHGQVVAELFAAPLDPRGRDQAVARLRASEDAERAATQAVAQAHATLDQSRRTLARAESLFAKNLISSDERERAAVAETTAVAEVQAANFKAQAAQHDVEQNRATLAAGSGTLRLVSPVSGQILRIPERSERVVQAGTPLLEIGDASRLEIVADLLSSDAVKVHPGDRVIVEGWGGDHPLQARVRVVEPSGFTKVSALGVEEQRVNVIADLLETPPPEQLGDGYRVEVRVVVWEGGNVLTVPASGLFQDNGRWWVFVAKGGRARRLPVVVGHRTPFEAEIDSGLVVGDLVVRHPSDQLSDGVRVSAAAR